MLPSRGELPLPGHATEADLKEAFEAHGAVQSVAITKDMLACDSLGLRIYFARRKSRISLKIVQGFVRKWA